MVRRLLSVYRTIRRQRLDTLLPDAHRPWIVRTLFALSRLPASEPLEDRGDRLRQALEELGPVFIKFGQLLSTRRDLLPDDIADALALLQDQVPSFPTPEAITLIEKSLGASIDTLFAEFEQTPLAAASVAQVHGAVLSTGEVVVVKVLRPDIETTIRADLRLIKQLAFWVGRFFKDGRRLRPMEVAADYERTLLDELDLRREAGNASQLRRNFLDSGLVYVPAVHWPLVTRDVMVSERIKGIPVSDIDTLHRLGVNMKLLAERGVEIFFTQVFRDSFFHADMHPGNIFVDASNPEDPSYLAVDCAIVGQLSESDLYYLARNLLAIFKQDYRLVAKLHVECGWVPADTPVAEFETAMRTLCEPVFERPLEDISFGTMLVTLFRTAGRFNMEVQPQLVLLQKTLLNIEGLGRQLYPELNLWDTAKPFLERWLSERYAPQSVWKRLRDDAPAWLETLPLIPDLVLAKLRTAPVNKKSKPSTTLWMALGVVGAGASALAIALSPTLPWLAGAGGALFALAIFKQRS